MRVSLQLRVVESCCRFLPTSCVDEAFYLQAGAYGVFRLVVAASEQ